MNSTDHDGELTAAVTRSASGADTWVAVVRHQQAATPDHSDFYSLAGDMVATLHALDSLAGLLARQAAGYATGQGVYDDEGANPAHRLRSAVLALTEARAGLVVAERAANQYWSAIGHIGVEVSP